MSKYNQIINLFIMGKFSILLNTHPFSKITVKEIVSISGIPRNTFYNHFRDKYDLLKRFLAHFIGPILINLNYHKFIKAPFTTLIQYQNSKLGHVKLKRLLLFQKQDHKFMNTLSIFLFDFTLNNIKNSHILWILSEMHVVIQWNALTHQNYNVFRDYKLFDQIIRTHKFPVKK